MPPVQSSQNASGATRGRFAALHRGLLAGFDLDAAALGREGRHAARDVDDARSSGSCRSESPASAADTLTSPT